MQLVLSAPPVPQVQPVPLVQLVHRAYKVQAAPLAPKVQQVPLELPALSALQAQLVLPDRQAHRVTSVQPVQPAQLVLKV